MHATTCEELDSGEEAFECISLVPDGRYLGGIVVEIR